MKFLCDNCKAKYQIADDKVAGKTVRMKCRKCGHQIEVRAAVTETSVSSLPPRPSSDARGSASAPYAPKTGLATSLSSTKPRPASTAPQQPRPAEGGGALAGAFQRQVEHAPQTVPYPTQGQGAVELSVTDEWYVAINGVPVGPVRISELRRKAASGVVTDDSLCWQEGLEEWRPIRAIPELATIVREAAQQNRPSLVNPEPLEQQRKSQPPPRPAPAAPRPSAASPAAPRVASEPPRPTAPSHPSAGISPFAPSRSNVVPLHAAARLSQADDAPPMTAPATGAAAVAFAVPQTSPLAPPMQQPAPLPAPPPPAAADPFAFPPPAAAPDPFAAPPPAPMAPIPTPAPMPMAPLASPSDPFAMAPAPRASQVSMLPLPAKKGVPIWFWLVGLFVVSFGGVAAFFLFRAPATQVVVREVAVNAPSATTTEATNDVPAPTGTGDTTAPTGSQKVASNGTGAKTTSGGAATPATSAPKTGLDLKGLTPSGGGPDVGPGGPGGGPAGGGLDAAAVQKVVRDRGPAVRRKCWDTASADKSSVNVNVSVNVAGNGTVSGATATGDDPVVSKCIEGQVRSWSFPAPGAPTTVNIPFHFVRQ